MQTWKSLYILRIYSKGKSAPLWCHLTSHGIFCQLETREFITYFQELHQPLVNFKPKREEPAQICHSDVQSFLSKTLDSPIAWFTYNVQRETFSRGRVSSKVFNPCMNRNAFDILQNESRLLLEEEWQVKYSSILSWCLQGLALYHSCTLFMTLRR